MSANGERVLKNYWISTCSWRVRMVLAYKGLDYKYEAINLHKSEDDDPEYVKMNPSGVPTLIEPDGRVFTQSMAIMEYLEEKYPENSIMPKEAGDRALCRALALEIISGLQPLQNMGVAHLFKLCKPYWPAEKKNIQIGAKQVGPMGEVTNIKYLRDIITEKLWGFENLLSRTAGTHCFGDSFTIADAALMPQANACRSSFGLDLSIFPTISRVLANIEKLDCVQKTHPDVCPDAVKPVAKPAA